MNKNKLMISMVNLPSPFNISILWNGGSILGLLLGNQILTGLFLSMYYSSDISGAFSSVIHITSDVPNGWIFRLLHANAASFFFLFLYLHIGRNLYYQSFVTNTKSWMVGVSIYLLSMATAFLGYVLPWGQMSFWGATVITNLLSAIPYIGSYLVIWVWGGFSVGAATLSRFYSLHFLLPFVILVFVMLHLIFLHEKGSTSPLGLTDSFNKTTFHPYFTYKDIVGFIVTLMLIVGVCWFSPWILMDPENFLFANQLSTPTHIQPEWYFLFAYAILRSIPSKFGGVVALVASIIILYFLPVARLNFKKATSTMLMSQFVFWSLVIVFFILTWLGACPVEPPFISLAMMMTFFYFILFFLMMII